MYNNNLNSKINKTTIPYSFIHYFSMEIICTNSLELDINSAYSTFIKNRKTHTGFQICFMNEDVIVISSNIGLWIIDRNTLQMMAYL